MMSGEASASGGERADPTSPAYELSDQIGHLLRRAYQRHTAIFQRRISDLDVTAIQFAVLVAVRDGGLMPLTRVGAATAIDPATLRGVISRLSQRGLIESQNDAADRRQRLVSLTAAGRELIARLAPDALEITAETLSPLNPAEVLAIGFLLKKLS
jgi:DNA-binding MarR family transcriptional regulator